MEVIDLPIEVLKEADWNTNRSNEAMMQRLRSSIGKFGFVQNLVVRPIAGQYEVLSGNQRIKLLRELNVTSVPCVVVNLDDGHARLLAQALNHIHGEDDLGLRSDVVRNILRTIPQEEILSVLPDTLEGLKGMKSLGQVSISSYLQNWEKAQAVRLRNLLFKLTPEQLQIIERAVEKALPVAKRQKDTSPNLRGTALSIICKLFLAREVKDGN